MDTNHAYQAVVRQGTSPSIKSGRGNSVRGRGSQNRPRIRDSPAPTASPVEAEATQPQHVWRALVRPMRVSWLWSQSL